MHEWGLTVLVVVLASVISLTAAEGLLRWWDLLDPLIFEANPSYGYLMHPDQSVSPRGHRFRINHFGFRGADFEWDKPSTSFRIAFVGDSVTFGGGQIPDKDLFVNRVPLLLHRGDVESLNLSAPGWGIQNMAGHVTSEGLYHADLFVWVIPSADFRRPKTTLEENGFWKVKPWSRMFYGSFVLVRRAPELLGRIVGYRTDETHLAVGLEDLQKNLQVFHRTLAGVKQSGVSCLVVIVPSENGDGLLHDDFLKFRSQAESLGVPVLDMRPAFEGHAPAELFFDGVHLSSRGHEVVAKSIVDFLRGSMWQGGSPSRI